MKRTVIYKSLLFTCKLHHLICYLVLIRDMIELDNLINLIFKIIYYINMVLFIIELFDYHHGLL